MSVRRRDLAAVSLVALVFGAGPTVGDIGSCGRAATDIDETAFAAARKQIDCQRCTSCGFQPQPQTCAQACNPQAPSDVGWPSTCHPLAHDGEVCLRALQAASCSDYASFVSDVDPTAPTECDFCHLLTGPISGAPSGDP